MKISKSKQELARIISENGGWRDGEFTAQDKTSARIDFYKEKPWIKGGQSNWNGEYIVKHKMYADEVIQNWHQTILSRAEYFHIYPSPDADVAIAASFNPCADGFEVGGVMAQHTDSLISESNVAQYTPRITAVTTIEQLAADYRNTKDFALRLQEEANNAWNAAEKAKGELIDSGKAIGIDIQPITAKQEPELVITDWRDLRVGDVIWVGGTIVTVDEPEGECEIIGENIYSYASGLRMFLQPFLVRRGDVEFRPDLKCRGWRFIRRP